MRLALALAACLALAGCAAGGPEPPLAPHVDVNRYLGRWYIIANIPYFLEKGEVGSYVDFTRRPDGDIAESYSAHDKSFDAKLSQITSHDKIVPNTNGARWRTSFFWPVYFSELILYVDPDYKVAIGRVSGPLAGLDLRPRSLDGRRNV